MEFAFFFVILTAFCAPIFLGTRLLYLFWSGFTKKGVNKKKAFGVKGFGLKLGLASLLTFALSLLYLPLANSIWSYLYDGVFILLDRFGFLQKHHFIDVYQVAQFFRFLYPAMLGVTILGALLFSDKSHRHTVYYRFYKGWSHRAIWTLVVWVLYILAERLAFNTIGVLISRLFLNLALLWTAPYFLYGVSILIFKLRKGRWLSAIMPVLLYSAILLSGPLFLYICALYTGIGISDWWMDYRFMGRKKTV